MELGLAPNFKKTMGVAAKRCKFLGFIIDSEPMQMHVPDTRMKKLNEALQVLLERDDDASAKKLASVCGKAMSMAPAIPAARCLTRETYNIIRSEEGDWDVMIKVTQAVKDELKEIVVWLKETVVWLKEWNKLGAPIRRPLGACEFRLVSDAGPDSYGYRIEGKSRQLTFQSQCVAETA